ncbi:hypothetical protein ABZW18_19075 [Streptomyces sp. NPDC004647]|uniref:hypothetical protein n=1 Tax=Streptomyces sp. NPDC004647 TaxID=3154671 RepID=UPI0033A41ECF
MSRKGSAGSRARQVALSAVREALERGEVPIEAPELVHGNYGEFWVGPDGRVYIRPTQELSAERARAQRVVDVQLVVDPGGRSAGERESGPEWRGSTPWNDDMSRLSHWQAADGSWLVIDEL